MKIYFLIPFFCLSLFLPKSISQNYPNESWEKVHNPAFSGWDIDGLEKFHAYVVDSTATTGMVIIQNGKVVFEYGNIEENSYIASCRKSILAMLYGKYVENGRLDLDQNMQDLAIDEFEPLLEIEKKAKIRDVLASRSGIFLPASNPGDLLSMAPERGSVEPGSFWLYSNWDFNQAGYIFENFSGNSIYDEIESQFAIPLEMQDWDRSLQTKGGSLVDSDVLAYHMWFSARDMARLGLVMLNKGKWKEEQIISEAWVKEMTTAKTTFEELNETAPFFARDGGYFSYGYMWWLWESPDNPMLRGAYSAKGAWGQNITVIPELDIVVAIKTNALYQRRKGNHEQMIDRISRMYSPEKSKKLQALSDLLEDDKVSNFLEALKGNDLANIDFDLEDELNKIGYNYLHEDKLNSALAIFKFNVKQNPKSWNVYDSLGEAQFLLGKYKESSLTYKKALDLNTENQFDNNKRVKHILNRIDLKLSKAE